MTEHDHTDCRDLLGSLSDYVDGSLGDQLCLEIERHMSECQNCRIVVDTLRKTISLYHQTAAPADVPAGVRERLFRTLNLEDYPG
ncbi:MAG: zf-HC2 domain-containing protein [Anaerolineales bacterium]|nr:zf-HC2 domain-containing protein [Anaerolineales bacterium]